MNLPSNTDARRVAITADDFGAHESINAAVEHAYRDGLLTTTSLMVSASAANDAVTRAHRNPGLAVGLHLVLTDGYATLPPDEIPQLVDRSGRFDDNMARAGVRFAFDSRARRQLGAEIRAQFAQFAATGLRLDHVNAHKHFHIHPTILQHIIAIGREYGLDAIRWPYEPASVCPNAANSKRLGERLLTRGWLGAMRRRIKRAGLNHNQAVRGLGTTGHTTADVMASLLSTLPAGKSEIYLHPALANDLPGSPSGADHRGEYEALVAPSVQAALDRSGATPIAFGAL